jgi:hypothetical protein
LNRASQRGAGIQAFLRLSDAISTHTGPYGFCFSPGETMGHEFQYRKPEEKEFAQHSLRWAVVRK